MVFHWKPLVKQLMYTAAKKLHQSCQKRNCCSHRFKIPLNHHYHNLQDDDDDDLHDDDDQPVLYSGLLEVDLRLSGSDGIAESAGGLKILYYCNIVIKMMIMMVKFFTTISFSPILSPLSHFSAQIHRHWLSDTFQTGPYSTPCLLSLKSWRNIF